MPETPLSSLGIYSAVPTVRIDGAEDGRVTENLLAMEMTEREGGLSALELRFMNLTSDTGGGADLAFEDEAVLRLGASVAIYAGDRDAPREIFQGAITGLEAEFGPENPPELVVLAEDAFQLARLARRTAVHENVTLADLASRLAGRLGLTPVVTGLAGNLGTHVQLNESDLAFLRRLLAVHDGDIQIVGRELHVSPRQDVRRGAVELELHSQLKRIRALADLAHQATEVTTAGWDAVQGQRVTGQSAGARLGPGAGRTGAQLLQQALGARSEHVGHLAVATSDEAQALADAAFDRRARRFVRVEATAEGNPELRVGTHVTLRGISRRFDNTYYVVHACHRFDQTRGYETDFQAECAYWGVP